ncbi:PHD finger domain protein [Aspergillus rambellii]|uniref:PHD finger domain protein n=1 Tax=Aspergillus rambellii TaxID=308745 RepID=A0A0F8UMC6_9EURO|nr:PHD finger domain protein [Aspergillus rambellii]
MVSRKRTRSELRNSWEFANLMQYIAIFGKLMKIDEDFGIEDLENECLKPGTSEKLLEIGLCLLKWVSSHRGLTFDNFDEYTRRQYNAKAPHVPNPFGYDETPNKFSEFDVFLKLRVLHQLTIWTFWNPDRIRDKMPEQREIDQTQWRIEEVGYDREGRYYYILDDNRLYRRTDPPLPPPKPAKSKSKRKSARAVRASKRRRVVGAASDDDSDGNTNGIQADAAPDPFANMKWECIAITLPDYQEFLDSIKNTRDADEKILRDRIEEQVLPVIEKEEAAQERQRAKREKELANLQLLAGAKRSSRIAEKAEKERHDRETVEAAQKREVELTAARKEEERMKKMESERRSRMMTREQRIKDRERKRLLHESELQRIEEEQKKLERGESRASERHLRAELEKQRKNLEDLSQEDEWIFDCSGCGVHGENLDDGSHSVACEKCNVWQHSKCLGIAQDEAEREDFHFVCKDCKRREEEAKLPKIPPLKFRLGSSPSQDIHGHGSHEDTHTAPKPTPTKMHDASSMAVNGSPSKQPVLSPQSHARAPVYTAPLSFPPPSPERRSQPMLAASFSPSRAPFSPSKGVNGLTPSFQEQPPKLPSIQQATHLPPLGRGPLPPVSFGSRRPSSSHSINSLALLSPIQNRPSMSPTQGNRDVGPLAGFPPMASSDSNAPWTPFGHHQTPRPSTANHPSFSSISSANVSFMATPTTNRSSTPQNSQPVLLSGLSPTKQSPRPMTSGSLTGAPILPPIQKLEPSPKLMGRSSPDAPIPPPVKCMTPEQEERRQRENAMGFHSHFPSALNGQPVMSSPSINRIPPLEPSAAPKPEMSPTQPSQR